MTWSQRMMGWGWGKRALIKAFPPFTLGLGTRLPRPTLHRSLAQSALAIKMDRLQLWEARYKGPSRSEREHGHRTKAVAGLSSSATSSQGGECGNLGRVTSQLGPRSSHLGHGPWTTCLAKPYSRLQPREVIPVREEKAWNTTPLPSPGLHPSPSRGFRTM